MMGEVPGGGEAWMRASRKELLCNLKAKITCAQNSMRYLNALLKNWCGVLVAKRMWRVGTQDSVHYNV